jgi:DNA-binding NtrC family response regulator
VNDLKEAIQFLNIVAARVLDKLEALPTQIEVEPVAPLMLPLAVIEREHILQVLAFSRGNRSEAARVLGIDRRTLYRKLREYRVPHAMIETNTLKESA